MSPIVSESRSRRHQEQEGTPLKHPVSRDWVSGWWEAKKLSKREDAGPWPGQLVASQDSKRSTSHGNSPLYYRQLAGRMKEPTSSREDQLWGRLLWRWR